MNNDNELSPEDQAEIKRLEREIERLTPPPYLRRPSKKRRNPADRKAKRKAVRAARRRNR